MDAEGDVGQHLDERPAGAEDDDVAEGRGGRRAAHHLGATADPTFGHVVVFGAGGTLVEVLSDVAFRIHPLSDVDAEDMVSEVRTARLLRGVRGAKPADVAALHDILMRLSALIEICPE